MKFKELKINYFRNFEKTSISLDNKNVVFGMNDVGKTNFLYALRYLLDKDIRKKGFEISDYYRRDFTNDIEICLSIDISDYKTDCDTQKLLAMMHGDVGSKSSLVYIKLIGKYDLQEEISYPEMFWGDDEKKLVKLNSNGPIFPLDKVFKVVYIDALVDVEKVFRNNKSKLFEKNTLNDSDIKNMKYIDKLSTLLNARIGRLSTINNFQDKVTDEYKKFRNENIRIELKSQIEINGYFNDLVTYIKRDSDSNYYPTSGDGRKKLLAYSIINILNEKEEKNKVLVYLVEESENSLHKTMQIALSKELFCSGIYNYLFVSTHSSLIINEMDDVNLIRIYSKMKIECKSCVYKVDNKYMAIKRKLNKNLSEALFSEKVLLVEGPSEKVLFDRVMEMVKPEYELDGGYILDVKGVGFEKYREILLPLDIKVIMKTDNDLRKSGKEINKTRIDGKLEYELLGINRCINYTELKRVDNIEIDKTDDTDEKKRELRRIQYNLNIDLINELKRKYSIYLSEIDLENDLVKALGSKLITYANTVDVVNYLYKAKQQNMANIITKFTNDDCNEVYNSDEFECLREL